MSKTRNKIFMLLQIGEFY